MCASILAARNLLVPARARAQTSAATLMMTWRAQSYVPEYFLGKALPSPNARIVVALEVLESGRRANLSGATMYWYVDDTLISNTPGAQSISLLASDAPGVVREVRAEIHNYNGRDETLVKTIRIPTIVPQAVVEAPFANASVASPSFTLRARPFYFNIADPTKLLYLWDVDGKTPNALQDPSVLAVTLIDPQPGRTMQTTLSIQNPGKTEEDATGALTITFNQ